MPVSVLVVLPAQDALRESARANQSGRGAGLDTARTRAPAGVTLDPLFPAVPLGSGAADATAASMDADRSGTFVVRGTMDAYPPDAPGARIFADPVIETLPVEPVRPGGPARGTVADMQAKLDVAWLHARRLDGHGVAVAFMDTGINLAHLRAKGLDPALDASVTWAPAGVTAPPGTHPAGHGPEGHGTMCAYDMLSVAPRATLLDYPIILSPTPGGSNFSGFLGDAFQAFAHLTAFWAITFGPTRPRYSALVVNNSWGLGVLTNDFPAGHPGRYADNPGHPFNVIVGALARAGADVLYAAGNCGMPFPSNSCGGHTSPSIFGANAHPDVLTLAGCDVTDLRAGYSSQGPSIPGMFAQKPDVTSYTHFLGSEALAPGKADGGTSAACPVAAGCVAALRSALTPATVPPAALFAELRTLARHVEGAGWYPDYGHGIIDPVAVARAHGLV